MPPEVWKSFKMENLDPEDVLILDWMDEEHEIMNSYLQVSR